MEAPQWSKQLKTFVETHTVDEVNDLEGEIEQYMKEIEQQNQQKQLERDPSLAKIPRFFFKKAMPDSRMHLLLRKEAQTRFLEKQGSLVLESDEMDMVCSELIANATPPVIEHEERVNYDAFFNVGAKVLKPDTSKATDEKRETFFSAECFLKFPRDDYGRISVASYCNYLLKKVFLYQTRISFSIYDNDADGYLTENDLETYIYDMIPQVPVLSTLTESVYEFYVATAVRKFMFFLDQKNRSGKISIDDLMESPVLEELLEVQNMNPGEENDNNWFSAGSVTRVYSLWLQLDTNQNRMLSKNELARYTGASLTDVFLDRVFEECNTYEGEMDYKTFLDFVLAMENKNTEAGLQFFWRILDVEKKGYITPFHINFFFRDIQKKLKETGAELVAVRDVADEIFDMVKPAEPLKIRLKDLVACKVGDTVINMLIDVNGFWAYDNREALLQQEPEQGTEESAEQQQQQQPHERLEAEHSIS
eukprot:GEZU01022492.1.p1 GENE.GEZU01022492.1~~GEZU01022492.1.p1  ORF type:complete len:492 (-),score=119.13 GEZU01022492.1:753-2186(-)